MKRFKWNAWAATLATFVLLVLPTALPALAADCGCNFECTCMETVTVKTDSTAAQARAALPPYQETCWKPDEFDVKLASFTNAPANYAYAGIFDGTADIAAVRLNTGATAPTPAAAATLLAVGG